MTKSLLNNILYNNMITNFNYISNHAPIFSYTTHDPTIQSFYKITQIYLLRKMYSFINDN